MRENPYSFKIPENKAVFRKGLRDGIPIGLGYLAVAFSLGITAKNAGVSPFQGFLMSLLTNASAGQYAGITLIAAGSTYLEMAIMILVANARYLLMSCAMSQRMHPDCPWYHRPLMAYDITDELFAIAIARQGYLNPYYTYGAVLSAAPFWAVGTALGCIAGNIMPLRVISALSVALFGMFLAVIVPAARRDKVIAGLVIVCFVVSYIAYHLPALAAVSSGTKTILLTVALSAAAAILFPHKETTEEETKEEEAANEP